ncbi:pyridoxal phosphate-dependent aminotransferase family protein [Pedobacter sp. MC2016-24]|nr:pyridoxal phosphate-dependent aminotransferase family protein [Pedobacter sp. MC2016-24]
MYNMTPFKQLQRPLNAHIDLDGQSYLYFGGTAYLGIPQDKAFAAHYLEGINRFGLNNGTSRGNNIQLGIYNDAEAYAGNYFGSDDTLITSSGYLAAQLAVRNLSVGKAILYAPQTHPSLWIDGAAPNELDFATWSKMALEQINIGTECNWLLVSNSINNLYPECYDFSFLTALKSGKKVTLLVDDSHGIGVLNGGKGVYSHLAGSTNVEVVVVASMAKALGLDAGIILGSKALIQALKESNEFLGASPPSAAGLYAFMHAEHIYQNALTTLYELIYFLAMQLNKDWISLPDFPVFQSFEPGLFNRLLAKQVLISSFPYPTPKSEPVNRIVLSSWHSKAQVYELVKLL